MVPSLYRTREVLWILFTRAIACPLFMFDVNSETAKEKAPAKRAERSSIIGLRQQKAREGFG